MSEGQTVSIKQHEEDRLMIAVQNILQKHEITFTDLISQRREKKNQLARKEVMLYLHENGFGIDAIAAFLERTEGNIKKMLKKYLHD